VAYINVSGTGNFATLVVSTATITSSTGTGVLSVPGMQNVTLNNGNSVYRWKQLDTTSELAIATPLKYKRNLTRALSFDSLNKP